jgi:hypothetical protein
MAFGRRKEAEALLRSLVEADPEDVRSLLLLSEVLERLGRGDARSQRGGDKVNLDKLAGRVESLQLLYRDLSLDGWGQAVDLGHYLSQIASAVVHTYAVEGIRLDINVDYAPVSINIAMPGRPVLILRSLSLC